MTGTTAIDADPSRLLAPQLVEPLKLVPIDAALLANVSEVSAIVSEKVPNTV